MCGIDLLCEATLYQGKGDQYPWSWIAKAAVAKSNGLEKFTGRLLWDLFDLCQLICLPNFLHSVLLFIF